ncbi:MAG TPA: PfkB family carbohydrate kinase, partial [Micromonosporaceae bacterium]|nr:PfkB family carbohydrate kinase [Micromonosporaceae bacterium]
ARVAELAAAGVRCAVRRCPDTTTGAVVVLSGFGERSMLCDRGANLHLTPSDVEAALAGTPGAAHLHLSGYTLLDPGSRPAGRHALAAAAARGLTTSVDAASADPLRRAGRQAFLDLVRGTDVLLANLEEAVALVGRELPPAALASALTRHAGTAVVKLGGDGAVWADRTGASAAVPAEPAEVVDPTGAGDAFAAGLLAAWLAGHAPVDALRAGARLGAQAVALVGGRP